MSEWTQSQWDDSRRRWREREELRRLEAQGRKVLPVAEEAESPAAPAEDSSPLGLVLLGACYFGVIFGILGQPAAVLKLGALPLLAGAIHLAKRYQRRRQSEALAPARVVRSLPPGPQNPGF